VTDTNPPRTPSGKMAALAPPKILVVDDHEPLAQALQTILARAGYQVVVSPTGENLLALIAAEKPQLMLLDIMMPKVDGLTLLEQLKEDERFRDLPVLMMSSMDPEDATVRSLGLGAADFLPKPIRQRELLARVEAHLKLGRAAAESRKEASNRAAMVEILHEITDSLKPDEIYNILVRRVARVLNISKCSIVLAKPGDKTGKVVASFENPMLRNLEVDLARYPEIERALAGGAPVLVSDVTTDPLYENERRRWQAERISVPTRSAVAVPFSMKNRQVGVFFLRTTDQGDPLQPTDGRFAESVIQTAVAAIEKAYDFESAMVDKRHFEQLASTDALTGTMNRRALADALAAELDRARRYNLYLSVLIADLDRFKQVNDIRGHLAGDGVLRQVGDLLRHEARSVDLIARYGGEEFVVVMPETTVQGAAVFAERVRGKVQARNFAPSGEEPLHLTVSIGLAGFPDERVTSADSFLALADQALYRAKNEGRNLVRE
jgi:two-component system, cell cycle response regulator